MYTLVALILTFSALVLVGIPAGKDKPRGRISTTSSPSVIYLSQLERDVIPAEGFTVPAKWGTGVSELVNSRAIDSSSFFSSMMGA
ncbi:MAG TPA: hypothetical protein VKO45_08515, partial [Methanomicrobiales archaeon]|nr:hypothetical protein [Methanomicrobiales archaeon]